ncbi:MAG: UvrD-helicase domain-containing protein [Candidatus Xenobia bacterium]
MPLLRAQTVLRGAVMIEIITASAGTGKTWQLTALLSTMISTDAVLANRVMATTFTTKAAQELMARARTRLLQDGARRAAQLLTTALVGTVNSIGGRLLSHFAFELGLSPHHQVLADEDTMICLQEALEDVFLEEPWRTQVHRAAEAFGIGKDEWHEIVRQLVWSARANRVPADAMEQFGRNSAHLLQSLLDPPQDGPHDKKLLEALENTSLLLSTPTLKVEHDAHQMFTNALTSLKQNRLRWSQWAKLSKLEGGKSWNPVLARLRGRAAAYMLHPRLRHQIHEFVTGVFHFASAGLRRYRDYKIAAGLMDFGDQEERLLDLLERPEHQEAIADRVQVLLVDEFQDTSPMQLAIFLKLSELAKRAVWVGDPKQANYEFRGADTVLMTACLNAFPSTALTSCFRATHDLITLVSRVFSEPFQRQGLPCPPLLCKRETPVQLQPCLDVWALDADNREEEWQAISAGIVRLVDPQSHTWVQDPATQEVRAVQPGDIAILCRRRESCRQIAIALTRSGLNVAYEQPGILKTVEGQLLEAGMRLLLDPGDTLAAATIAFLDRPEHLGEEVWLEQRIRKVAEGAGHPAWGDHPRIAALHHARREIHNASPWEVLEMAITALDLPRLCLSFPQASQRLANLEALRGMAHSYEERCRTLRAPASPAGLLAFMRRMHHDGADKGVEGTSSASVRVLTYHGAKGLEWPVVVLSELDCEFADVWRGVSVRHRGEVDLSNPLADRDMLFCFSPFERQSAGVPFLTRLRASDTAGRLNQQALDERVRLLYVGFTRARDHLVLAARAKNGRFSWTPWLQQVMTLPPLPTDGALEIMGITARGWSLSPGDKVIAIEHAPSWYAAPLLRTDRQPATMAASSASSAPFMVAEVDEPGQRMQAQVISTRDVLGTMVHAFLAADTSDQNRLSLANRILNAYGQCGAVPPERLLDASNCLRRFLAARYPDAVWHREWPIAMRQGDQEIWGQADLVLECAEGWVVVDYKTFEGPAEEAASQFGAQIALYARAVSIALKVPVIGLWIYQVTMGRMIRIEAAQGGSDGYGAIQETVGRSR